MSMNLTKLAKKLVQESINRKKNTDSLAEFHLKQLNLSVYFLVIGQFLPSLASMTEMLIEEEKLDLLQEFVKDQKIRDYHITDASLADILLLDKETSR